MAAKYETLPARYSNKRKSERLTVAAAHSLHRMSLRMVPGASANFSIYSALRTTAEQHDLFVANYRNTGKTYPNGDRPRKYKGTYWARKPNSVAVAVPGSPRANHESGLAIDIHPGAIQSWLKRNGNRFGWDWAEGKRNNEDWHFRYYPGQDKYKGEGVPDIAGMQRALGIEADGKVGLGFVAAVKKFQEANGLTVDGIAGPDTQKAILGEKGSGAPAPSEPDQEGSSGTDLVIADLPDVESGKASPNKHTDRVDPRDGKSYGIKHITVHWWGTPLGQAFDGIVAHLCNKSAEVSAHYVISSTRVAQIVDEKDSSWANGNRVANFESVTIECDPNDVLGTIPVLAALIKDIRGRHGDLPIYPHQHWTSTACPGDYLPHLDAVDQMARTGKAVVDPVKPAPAKPSKVGEDGRLGRETVTALQKLLGVTADGRAGENTWKALQKRLGTPVDGVVSHQSYKASELGNGVVPRAWRYTGRGSKGSKMVVALQKRLGVKADGIWYEGTTKALQRKLNTGTKWLG